MKQEQLSKFRQTLHSQQSISQIDRQLPKRQTNSNTKPHLKSNPSL